MLQMQRRPPSQGEGVALTVDESESDAIPESRVLRSSTPLPPLTPSSEIYTSRCLSVRNLPILVRVILVAIVLVSSLALIGHTTGSSNLRAHDDAVPNVTTAPQVEQTQSPNLVSSVKQKDALMQIHTKINLCVTFAHMITFGGIETWWWALYTRLFNVDPIHVHAVSVFDLLDMHVAHKLSQGSTRFNIGTRAMLDQCDILIQTGVLPLPRIPEREIPRVLVVHGSDDDWTSRYAGYETSYHAFVGVSAHSVAALSPPYRPKMEIIPAFVEEERFVVKKQPNELRAKWGIPANKRILLFLGRLSDEKQPDFFASVVRNLSDDWVGLVVGPLMSHWPSLYEVYEGQQEDESGRQISSSLLTRKKKKMFVVGHYDWPADVLNMCDIVLLPSKKEGGPIVLIEAWGQRKPFFIYRTGLAEKYPEGVFLIGPTDTPRTVAMNIQRVYNHLDSPEVQGKLAFGYNNVQNFLLKSVAPRWQNILKAADDEAAMRSSQVNLRPVFVGTTASDLKQHTHDIPAVQTEGRIKVLNCNMDSGCVFDFKALRYLDWSFSLGQPASHSPTSTSSSSSHTASPALIVANSRPVVAVCLDLEVNRIANFRIPKSHDSPMNVVLNKSATHPFSRVPPSSPDALFLDTSYIPERHTVSVNLMRCDRKGSFYTNVISSSAIPTFPQSRTVQGGLIALFMQKQEQLKAFMQRSISGITGDNAGAPSSAGTDGVVLDEAKTIRGENVIFVNVRHETLEEAQKDCNLVPDCTGVVFNQHPLNVNVKHKYELRGATYTVPNEYETSYLKKEMCETNDKTVQSTPPAILDAVEGRRVRQCLPVSPAESEAIRGDVPFALRIRTPFWTQTRVTHIYAQLQ